MTTSEIVQQLSVPGFTLPQKIIFNHVFTTPHHVSQARILYNHKKKRLILCCRYRFKHLKESCHDEQNCVDVTLRKADFEEALGIYLAGSINTCTKKLIQHLLSSIYEQSVSLNFGNQIMCGYKQDVETVKTSDNYCLEYRVLKYSELQHDELRIITSKEAG